MKIATWNVNSIKVRLPHVMEWLAGNAVDVLLLQETKSVDDNFPVDPFRDAGYQVLFSGEKTYNGVAIVSRHPMTGMQDQLPDAPEAQKRFLAVTIGDLRIVDVYVPNGQSVGSDKFHYKLDWLSALKTFLQEECRRHPNLLIAGDFNIAPDDRDVFDPIAWEGHILVSPQERKALKALLDLPLVDCFRLLEEGAGHFSWWDYRSGSFPRNKGLRIDLILATAALGERLTSCTIDAAPRGWERPSDHAPVVATFR